MLHPHDSSVNIYTAASDLLVKLTLVKSSLPIIANILQWNRLKYIVTYRYKPEKHH